MSSVNLHLNSVGSNQYDPKDSNKKVSKQASTLEKIAAVVTDIFKSIHKLLNALFREESYLNKASRSEFKVDLRNTEDFIEFRNILKDYLKFKGMVLDEPTSEKQASRLKYLQETANLYRQALLI